MAKKVSYRALVVLIAEIIVFVGLYFLGDHGLAKLSLLREENMAIERDIIALHHEIELLESDCAAWLSDNFYKEKYAREHLQMAYPDEEIFFI